MSIDGSITTNIITHNYTYTGNLDLGIQHFTVYGVDARKFIVGDYHIATITGSATQYGGSSDYTISVTIPSNCNPTLCIVNPFGSLSSFFMATCKKISVSNNVCTLTIALQNTAGPGGTGTNKDIYLQYLLI